MLAHAKLPRTPSVVPAKVVVSFGARSFPRKRESTPQTFGNVLSSDWIPPAERDGNDRRLKWIPIPNDISAPAKTPIVKSPGFRCDVLAGWSSLVARWAHNPLKYLPALSPHQLSFTVFSGFPSCFSQSVRKLLHESDHVRLEVTLARPSQLSNAQSLRSRCPEKTSLIGEPYTKLRRGAISCGNQHQNPLRSCHKKNSSASEVCLSLSSANSKQWGRSPQPPRNQKSPETDCRGGEEPKGGGA